MKANSTKPLVSVLIAARNESANIINCLDALEIAISKSDYDIEVLVGNDRSTDHTAALVFEWIQNRPQFRLLNISHNVRHLKAKANVLAQLAQEARGDFFFITDADISVPPTWFSALMNPQTSHCAVVTGLTLIKPKNLQAKWQSLEWQQALYWIHVLSERGFAVTSMGNNMLVSQKAYSAVGGYENIPFSITEDFELFKQVAQRGFQFKNLYQKDCLAWSEPTLGLKNLLQQRKRWMHGAMQSQWFLRLFLLFNSLQWLLWPLFFVYSFQLAALVFVVKYSAHIFSLLILHKKLDLRPNWFALLSFEFYNMFLYGLLLPYYYWPSKTVWKSRNYE